MTKVEFIENSKGIRGFVVKDHTGFAEHGTDIVCAAISALAQTTVIGIQEVVNVACEVEIKDAYLVCKLPTQISQEQWDKCQIVLQTLKKGLTAIRDEYPNYVNLKEVQSL